MDTLRRDTAVVLAPVTVTVTRTARPLNRLPLAASALGRDAIRRGQPTLGLDETLNSIPGVYAANRFNYSLDQRLSIRGFGARANFGTRGIKILLDGVPQTLPDGQSQLTNLDLASVERIEVIRGPASSLYGNASGGVVSITSEAVPPGAFSGSTRVEGGSFGLYKSRTRLAGRSGALSGLLTLSRLDITGFRAHSGAEALQLGGIAEYALGPRMLLTVRGTHTSAPVADNPGALTLAELQANPRAAAPNNVLRDAGKDLDQQQASATLRFFGQDGDGAELTVFGFRRGLNNPLATGVFVELDRLAGGIRLSGTLHLPRSEGAPWVTAGLDLQRMRDDRSNTLTANRDSTQVRQRETVTELGPFVQVAWSSRRLALLAGARYDRLTFDVADHHLSDGTDNSGTRTLAAWSAMAGASYELSSAFIPYGNLSTSFETPTTTELANQPNTTGGFNDRLGPQRALSYEAGIRGHLGTGLQYSAAAFLGRVQDAIVQYQEVGGRAYFTNAGRLHADGLEAAVTIAPKPRWSLAAAYTYAHYRFARYVVVTGNARDTLDGNTLPGVPTHFLRLSLAVSPFQRLWVDLNQTLSSSLYADDGNAITVDGWGPGITNLRVSWSRRIGRWELNPFGGVSNLFDRTYVSSVTVNGANGRVFEPGAGRGFWVGAEVGFGGAP